MAGHLQSSTRSAPDPGSRGRGAVHLPVPGPLARLLWGTTAAWLAATPPAKAQAPFTEEAAARGISYLTIDSAAGRGVALCDLDGDLDPDLMCIGAVGGAAAVWENDGTGHFIDRSAQSGIPSFFNASGLVCGDVDGDGRVDVYVSQYNGPNVLLRNEGGFTFSDVTAIAGVGDPGPGSGCTMADYDGDGWLDLFVTNYNNGFPVSSNRLYRNLGGGVFTDVAPALGLQHTESLTWMAVFFDADLDGDADLFLSNDKCGGVVPSYANYLLRNDGGTFTDVSAASGLNSCIDSMGVAVGDWNEDGLFDLYVTNTNMPSGNPLLVSTGPMAWQNLAAAQGVASGIWSWGTELFDYDNDRRLELYVCNRANPNSFFDRPGAGPATQQAAALGIDTAGTSYASAVADVDLDGDLDLLVQTANQPIRLYINHEGETRSWVEVRVVGDDTNTTAIGAFVSASAGGLVQRRQVLAGTSFKSQSDHVVHFGLGSATVVDQIFVRWPATGATRTLTSYPAQRRWTAWPASRLADLDGDGAVDGSDLGAFVACRAQALLEPGCEFADLDGDGDVDATDSSLFRARWTGALEDCNHNGVPDVDDVLAGTSADANSDGLPDECTPVGTRFCAGDGGVAPGCTPCPCLNEAPPGTDGGCLNSAARSARLAARGSASVLVDALRFEAFGTTSSSFAVLVSAANRLPANAANPCFGLDSGLASPDLDGLRCVGGALQRHGTRPTNAAGEVGVTTNGWGPPSGPAGGIAAQGGFVAGQTRAFQCFYRENAAFGCGRGQNTSDAIDVLFTP